MGIATSLLGSFAGGAEGDDKSSKVYKKETRFGDVNTRSKDKMLVTNNMVYIIVIAIISIVIFNKK